MLLAVNTIGYHTEAEFKVPGVARGVWHAVFEDDVAPVVEGTIRVRFAPYQAKAFVLANP